MGLSDPEDIYILRKKSVFTNGQKPNVKLNGYDFISEKAITAQAIKDDPEKGQAKILNLAFNSPVLIKDYRQFFSLANMFKAVIMVVYVDPQDPNKDRILEAMVEARKRIPLDLKPDNDGSYDINKNKDVLFVLSTTPNLMFFQF